VSVTDEALAKIREMIASGEFKPGDRLPKEADLAARLEVSRNSLREAIRALSLIHIVDVRQGDGTYVTSMEPELLSEAVSFVIDFHRADKILHLLGVRRVLEPAATALAAAQIGEPDLAALRALLDEMHATASVEAIVRLDAAFHSRIASCSGNPVLASLIDAISAPTTRARVWRGITQEGAVQRTHEEHERIYAALASHEPELARAWATVHVAGVEQWLRVAAESSEDGELSGRPRTPGTA
jgi:GntR family transcriptional regulator, transcriptional repressor for pyruvate dehydrogenase complex